MYWWNLKAVKNELTTSSFSDAKIFPYFLVYTVVLSLVLVPVPGEWTNTQLDVYNGLIGMVIAILGTYYTYRCNGGVNGKDFLQRYFVLGLVVGVRFGVVVMLPALVLLFGVLAAREGFSEATTWGDVVFVSLLSLAYFWRLAKHIKDVATSTSVTTKVPASTESVS